MTIDTSMRVRGTRKLITPKEIEELLPLTDWQRQFVEDSRITIQNILDGKDDRLLLIVGPCSIHDPEAFLDYVKRLKDLAHKVKDRIYIVVRCYFEKPRTTIGWNGLVTSPDITYHNDFDKGLRLAREIMINVIDAGLPVATEFLDPLVPQYLADCVSWAAIGARTTESQTHRQMVSGLSMPVGFKNGTAGQYQLAVDAIARAKEGGSFLGIDDDGSVSEIYAVGNEYAHVVLRGGKNPVTGEVIKNYDKDSVQEVADAMERMEEKSDRIIIDCSHANSDKDHEKQIRVFRDELLARYQEGLIVGGMVESNIKAGSQAGKIPPYDKGPEAFEGFNPKKDLEYGMSITDACISWEDTESMILDAYEVLNSKNV